MTPNVRSFRKARGRGFVFLMSAVLWGLSVLSALDPQPAHALNGATRALTCQNCYTSGDFVAAGVAQAESEGLPGLYVVVGQTYARTGLIQVTGQVPSCGLSCGEGLQNVSGVALGQDGSPLGSDSELNNIDVGLFGVDRSLPLEANVIPGCGAQQPGCGTSLATSSDAGIGLEIGDVLTAAGYTEADLPSVLSIVVVFQNGDIAVYTHNSSQNLYVWTYGGYAWNAQHQPIDRQGNVINNPNSAGSGGGGGNGTNGTSTYGFSDYSDCVFKTSVSLPGNVIGNTVIIQGDASYLPC